MNKTWLKKAIVLSLVIAAFSPDLALAATIRTDKIASISESETLSGNVYLVGGEPKVLGNIDGDLVILGNNIEISGNTKGDILSLGGDILVKGNVDGDIRVFGANIIVEGSIKGDLLAVGGNTIIEKDSKIEGDTILVGGKVNINNEINKHLRVVAGTVFVSGTINSSANITSEKINFSKDSKIAGSINYFSPTQAHVEEGANVTGSINFNKIESIQENGLVKHAIVSFLNFWMLFRFITTLLLTFILVYVFKIFSQKTSLRAIESFGKSFLVGVISVIFVPAIIIICLISLILFPIAILLGMLYVGIFIISTCIAGIALGALLKKAFSKNKTLEISFQTAAIGVTILTLLQFVPYVGDITRFIFSIAAFGSIWLYFYEKIRWGEKINVLEKN